MTVAMAFAIVVTLSTLAFVTNNLFAIQADLDAAIEKQVATQLKLDEALSDQLLVNKEVNELLKAVKQVLAGRGTWIRALHDFVTCGPRFTWDNATELTRINGLRMIKQSHNGPPVPVLPEEIRRHGILNNKRKVGDAIR